MVVLPAEYAAGADSVYFIFFEHPEGKNFLPENTRDQSVPDIFDPPFRVSEVTAITLDDFTLVPATG